MKKPRRHPGRAAARSDAAQIRDPLFLSAIAAPDALPNLIGLTIISLLTVEALFLAAIFGGAG